MAKKLRNKDLKRLIKICIKMETRASADLSVNDDELAVFGELIVTT